MAQTVIHGSEQIRADTITNNEINSAAAIALSKLEEAVIQADGGQAFTADQSIGGFKLTSLADPVSGTDAVNKNYVDAAASGLDVKDSVRVATAAALPANTAAGSGVGKTLTASAVGILTVDGVATVLNDRILVKDESTSANNGIYKVTTEGTGAVAFVLTRATDFDEDDEVTAGAFTFAAEGSTYADSGLVLTTDDPITVDTTALSFTQFSGAGAITAGAGLTKTGSTIDAVAGDASLTVAADSIVVALDGTAGTIALGGAGLQIADGTAGYLLIGQGASVDTAFVAVTGDVAITSGGVTSLATDSVDSAEIVADAVGGAELDTRKETRTGSTSATWALLATPFDDDHLQLYRNGILLTEGGTEDYTRTGATITLADTPDVNDRHTAVYQV